MKHGSLFSGIGGFDLAAEWMGWQNVFHCEWNDFGRRVLNYYWPQSISYEDIKAVDFTIHKGQIDILTGGFPCQPYSLAGKRRGKDDDRHLWPEMLRAIREIQPRWVVGENVRGLVSWSGGLVFEEVQTDLENQGYEVQPFILPAAGVNAPHRRDRVWFVAYANGFGSDARGDERWCDRNIHRQNRKTEKKIGEWFGINGGSKDGKSGTTPNTISERDSPPAESGEIKGNGGNGIKAKGEGGIGSKRTDGLLGLEGDAADSNSSMRERRSERGQSQGRSKPIDEQLRRHDELSQSDFTQFPTQSPICGGDDGLPSELDGITFSKWRSESLKAYGNAIVPQVVYQIFKSIQEYEALKTK